jgi:hypothetical protein
MSCSIPRKAMKLSGSTSRLALAAGATLLLAACSISQLPGPKYVPESTAVLGPEPTIPSEWFGCWRGTVDHFDTATSFSPSISSDDLKALNTTYELCFTKNPDGSGRLDLKDLEIGGHKATVTHFDNRFASVGPGYYRASMRTHTTAVSAVYVLWIFPIHITQDVYSSEDLQMLSPDVVAVKGKQVIVVGGNMIASMTWHTDFHRTQAAGVPVAATR